MDRIADLNNMTPSGNSRSDSIRDNDTISKELAELYHLG